MRNYLIVIFYFFVMITHAQVNLITNVYNRETISLNGKWNYIVDPFETGYFDYRYQPFDKSQNTDSAYGGFYIDQHPKNKSERIEYSFDNSPTLLVPGDWNSQVEKLDLYEGTVWYRRLFDKTEAMNNQRVFVYFGAINYQSDIYLNGKKLGTHTGGFTPFCFDITDKLQEKNNYLIVKVDNKRSAEAVPTLNFDWWNYGGITRDVMLCMFPQTFIEQFKLQLKKGSKDMVSGFVKLNGNKLKQTVTLSIPELKWQQQVTTDEKGFVTYEFPIKNVQYWSPESPKLYNVEVSIAGDKSLDQIGFRTLEVKNTDILLNGKSVFLRGICIHEENPLKKGRASTQEDAQLLLNWAKELNCNFVRLAHYPHNEHIIRLADKMGIMVWEEIPTYWTIQWKNPQTLENAKNQLREVITRDQNRASSIIWSVANETPQSTERDQFLIALSKQVRELDGTRLVSAALEKHAKKDNPLIQIVEDNFAEYVDVLSFNQYVGWYDGLPDKCSKVSWELKYNKPVIVSEFGGDALQGLHGDSLTRWTEEYQEYLYKETLKMLEKIPSFRGLTPWILADFRSPKRLLPNVQDGWNRKGVIGETGTKKKAFFVLKNFYDEKETKYLNK